MGVWHCFIACNIDVGAIAVAINCHRHRVVLVSKRPLSPGRPVVPCSVGSLRSPAGRIRPVVLDLMWVWNCFVVHSFTVLMSLPSLSPSPHLAVVTMLSYIETQARESLHVAKQADFVSSTSVRLRSVHSCINQNGALPRIGSNRTPSPRPAPLHGMPASPKLLLQALPTSCASLWRAASP